MLNKIIGLLLFGWNYTTGAKEKLGKTNDSRHALNVEDQHIQALTEDQLRAAPVEVTGTFATLSREEQILHEKPGAGEKLTYDIDGVYEFIALSPFGAVPQEPAFDVARIEFTDSEHFEQVQVEFQFGMVFDEITDPGAWNQVIVLSGLNGAATENSVIIEGLDGSATEIGEIYDGDV